MRSIGFTGGSGFIGRYFNEYLHENSPSLAIKNLDLEKPSWPFLGETHVGDVRDSASCDKLCSEVDVVIHLAAAHKDFGIEKEEYFDVNENGTLTLLESMDKAGVKKLVFTSSVAVYDPADTNIDEGSSPSPQNHYGASKFAAEKVITAWTEKGDGRQAFVLRPTVVIGPRNKATMYSLIDQIYRGKYIFNMGKGDNVKSLALVKNLVAFVWERCNSDSWTEPLTITNFVDSPQMPTRKIISLVHEELGKKMPAFTIPLGLAAGLAYPIHLAARAVGKHSPITPARIRKLGMQTRFDSRELERLGYQPKLSTEAGLAEMVSWYLANRQSDLAGTNKS